VPDFNKLGELILNVKNNIKALTDMQSQRVDKPEKKKKKGKKEGANDDENDAGSDDSEINSTDDEEVKNFKFKFF
jgi:hypothetical protein